MKTPLFWVITQQVVVIPYQRQQLVKISYRRSASITNYHYSLSNNPEERSSHLLRTLFTDAVSNAQIKTMVTYGKMGQAL
jgi:hypothetical protein